MDLLAITRRWWQRWTSAERSWQQAHGDCPELPLPSGFAPAEEEGEEVDLGRPPRPFSGTGPAHD